MNTETGSINVASAIHSALAALSMDAANAFQQLYSAPTGLTVEQQIKHANCFWRQQLGLASVNTTSVRECLMDHCEYQDWIRWFASEVAPAIVGLGLPKSHAAA